MSLRKINPGLLETIPPFLVSQLIESTGVFLLKEEIFTTSDFLINTNMFIDSLPPQATPYLTKLFKVWMSMRLWERGMARQGHHRCHLLRKLNFLMEGKCLIVFSHNILSFTTKNTAYSTNRFVSVKKM